MVVARTKDDKTVAPDTVFDSFDFPGPRDLIQFKRHESTSYTALTIEELTLDFRDLLTLCIIPVYKEMW